MVNCKNTKWNCLFHAKKVKANNELKRQLESLIEFAPEFLEEIGEVTYTEGDYDSARVTGVQYLPEVLRLHKEAWAVGFQNESLGPDEYGMFRTKSIENMTSDEVFIGGNLWGLNTKNIPFWEKYRDEGKTNGGFPIYDYLSVYQIVLQRYKTVLTKNIELIKQQAQRDLAELKEMGY